MQQIDGRWNDTLEGLRRRVHAAPPPAPQAAPPPAPPAAKTAPRDIYDAIERHRNPFVVSQHAVRRVVEATYDNLGNSFMYNVWPMMHTKLHVNDIEPALEQYERWRQTVVAADLARLTVVSALCPDVYSPMHALVHDRLDKIHALVRRWVANVRRVERG
jgi:hypothetical protein